MSAGPADFDLVLLLRRRHPGAFDEVYRRHRERIWRFLHRLAGTAALAEDLFQETWLAAARNAHRLREDTVLLAWLYTIARNKHRNALRLAAFDRRREAEVKATCVAPTETPESTTDVRARVEKIGAAFSHLAAAHREVLLLCLVEGLETAAVAQILEVSAEVVRKRLSRARAELGRLSGLSDSEATS